MMQDLSIRFLTGLLLIAGLPGVHAQEQDLVISMDVHHVVLYVTVREGSGKFIGDLKKEDFSIKEDKVPQTITSFNRDDVPIAVGLLIDNSQSMMNKGSEVITAAKTFLRASNPGDEMFILHFNEKLTYGLPADVPFSSDRAELDRALDTIRLDGKTALYDAIFEGLKHLQGSKLTKRALVVISDGGDNMSLHKSADVVKAAGLSGALFYAIGIYDPMDGDANPGVIRKLAQETGGTSFFPTNVQDVKGMFETVARDLRSQYMISYSPANATHDGKFRRIEVKVKDPQNRKLIVRTRTGYYALPPASQEGKKQ